MKLHLFACLLLAPACQALELPCPVSPGPVPAGWQQWSSPPAAAETGLPAQATRIELYEGAPAGAGRRLPDDFAEAIGVAPLQWTLEAPVALHLVCSYQAGMPKLVRALPAGLAHCHASNEFEDQRLQLECR